MFWLCYFVCFLLVVSCLLVNISAVVKSHLQNDLLCVQWDIKLQSITEFHFSWAPCKDKKPSLNIITFKLKLTMHLFRQWLTAADDVLAFYEFSTIHKCLTYILKYTAFCTFSHVNCISIFTGLHRIIWYMQKNTTLYIQHKHTTHQV